MNERDEHIYAQGRRAAYVALLGHCLATLGYDSNAMAEIARLVAEREEAIALLRHMCAHYGDNTWDEKFHLADIREKHLYNHLEAL